MEIAEMCEYIKQGEYIIVADDGHSEFTDSYLENNFVSFADDVAHGVKLCGEMLEAGGAAKKYRLIGLDDKYAVGADSELRKKIEDMIGGPLPPPID